MDTTGRPLSVNLQKHVNHFFIAALPPGKDNTGKKACMSFNADSGRRPETEISWTQKYNVL